jgi:hypothetical protein
VTFGWSLAKQEDVRFQMLVHNKNLVVYYESIKRELKRRLIYEYRCDERPKTKNEESTLLTDTGLVVELERPRFDHRGKSRTTVVEESTI